MLSSIRVQGFGSPFRRALSSLVTPASRQSVCVRVPATTANMGPGFDCLGMSLGEYNVLEVERSPDFHVDILGEGADTLPRDKTNYYYRAFEMGFTASAPPNMEVPTVRLTCTNAIPPARGMGSSSACLVAGVSAGFAINGYDPEDDTVRMKVYQVCADAEGHPDNVAPAIYGGLQLSFRPRGDAPWVAQRIPVSGEVKAVLFIPDFEMPTQEARALLDAQVPRCVRGVRRLAVGAWGLARWELGCAGGGGMPTRDGVEQRALLSRLAGRKDGEGGYAHRHGSLLPGGACA